jgi:hypothetical protein
MKVIILILVSALISLALSSAQTDEEILQFADNILEVSMLIQPLTANVSISDDTLIITGIFKPEANISTGYIGSALLIMALASDKLIERYPNRFNSTDLKIFDSKNALVGEANIAALIAKPKA